MPFITQGKTNLRYILIVVILAAIVGAGILGYYYLWIKDLETRLSELEVRVPIVKAPEEETKPQEEKVQEAIVLIDVPKLYPELSWTEVLAGESFLGEPTLYYDHLKSNLGGDATLNGQKFTASQEILCTEENEVRVWTDAFGSYYHNEFSKRGWTQDITTHDFRIMPVVADRPYPRSASIWGYLKTENEKLRVILLNYDEELKLDCPYELKFRVFISDIVQLNEILPL